MAKIRKDDAVFVKGRTGVVQRVEKQSRQCLVLFDDDTARWFHEDELTPQERLEI